MPTISSCSAGSSLRAVNLPRHGGVASVSFTSVLLPGARDARHVGEQAHQGSPPSRPSNWCPWHPPRAASQPWRAWCSAMRSARRLLASVCGKRDLALSRHRRRVGPAPAARAMRRWARQSCACPTGTGRWSDCAVGAHFVVRACAITARHAHPRRGPCRSHGRRRASSSCSTTIRCCQCRAGAAAWQSAGRYRAGAGRCWARPAYITPVRPEADLRRQANALRLAASAFRRCGQAR